MLHNIWGRNNNECFLRRKITVDGEINTAYARVFADTGYELFINGRFVAEVDEWSNVRDYDVKLFLNKGENIIAMHGINHAGHRGCAFELAINGESVLESDETWKVCDSEKWGWMLADYDDSNWENACPRNHSAAGELQWWTKPGSDLSKVVPTLDSSMFFRGNIPKSCNSPYWTAKEKNFEPDRNVVGVVGNEYKEFTQRKHLESVENTNTIVESNADIEDGRIKITETQRYTGQSFIIDFEKEVVGFFRMKIESESSVSFRIYYGETYDEAAYEISRDVAQNRMLREEYRIFGGVQEFESRMKVGFRFARIEFFDCKSAVLVSDMSVRTALYPVRRKGYFACDDKDLTKLWEMGERTLHYCMQEYYYDAPKRDRFLWTGDARLENFINYYTFADTDLFEYCWEELEKVQRPDGSIPSSYGVGLSNLWDYVAWYVIAYYDHYMYTGKSDFILKHKDSLERATDYLLSLTDESGLINVPENPLGNLWMVELNTFVGYDPYLNSILLRAVETAVLANQLAENAEQVKKYTLYSNKIREAIKNTFTDDDLVKNFDTIHHTQIQYEMAETELKQGKYSEMMERIRKYWGIMIETGADCLTECTYPTNPVPRLDEHYTEKPSYLSFCHGWTAAATALLPMGIAGVTPLKPGFEEVEIKPYLDEFDWFKCVVPTPKGEIAIKFENKKFEWYVPDGIKAKIVIDGEIVSEEENEKRL